MRDPIPCPTCQRPMACSQEVYRGTHQADVYSCCGEDDHHWTSMRLQPEHEPVIIGSMGCPICGGQMTKLTNGAQVMRSCQTIHWPNRHFVSIK